MKKYPALIICLLLGQYVFAQPPRISSFSPESGPVGTAVTISGTFFGDTTINNIVFFGAVRAVVTAASPVMVRVIVPAGATFQPITITVNGLTAYSSKPFNVSFPAVATGFTPGSFAPKIDYGAGAGAACVVAGDFDSDGKPDLAVVNDGPTGVLSVFRNLSTPGNISLSPKTDFTTGSKPYCVAVGDLDGDGRPDLVTGNGNSNSISIFRNTSSGAGNIAYAPKLDLPTGTLPFCVAILDLDGDGKPELAVANSSSNTVSVFKNNGTPGNLSFSAKLDFITGSSPFWIAAGDLDNDGKPELAIANGVSANSVSILNNTSSVGNISFAPKIDFDGGVVAYSIMMGDIDGDGKPDLAIANGTGPSVNVLKNRSSGSGNFSFSRSTFSTGNGSFGITIADMDGDGKPDLVVPNSSENTVSVLKNKSDFGAMIFAQKVNFGVGSNPWVSVVVDLDGDGRPDIATANYLSGNISVVRNSVFVTGISSFTPVSAATGATITITGLNFVNVTGVSFGGIPADSFSVVSGSSITAVVGAGASGNIAVTTTDTVFSLAGFTYLPTPSISSFSPSAGGSGDTISIVGTNFAGTNAVRFGGIPASSFVVDTSNKKITAILGASVSGSVSLVSAGGTAVLSGFVYDNTPYIDSISPASAVSGSTITIAGKHFTGTTAVSFGGRPATSFTIVSPFIITAIVGAGASGNVVVTNAEGTDTIGGFIYLLPPLVTSFSPVSASPGTTVIITGNNFDNVLGVSFGDVPAASFTVNSSTSISAIVAGGSSGNVQVSSLGGNSVLSGFTYVSLPVPVINSLSPLAGPVGTMITIHGVNFNAIATGNVVYFGSVKAVVSSATSTELNVIAPRGATYQAITVTTNELTAYSAQFFNVTFGRDQFDFNVNSFASKRDFTTGNLPAEVKFSDLDGDGKPDMVVANYASSTISVFKNTVTRGNIQFAGKIDYSLPGKPGGSISVDDLDGDGKPDIAVTVESSYICVFRNTSTSGNISFSSRQDFPSGDTPTGIAAGDIDGDGKPDLVVANLHSATLSVFKNRGARGIILFEPRQDYSTGTSPYYVCINDFDGDNKADVAIANFHSNSVSVLKNASAGGLISLQPKIDFPVGAQPYKMSIGDINGDGKVDIASCNTNSASVSILQNASANGTISFTPKTDLTTGIAPYGVAIVDIDGDSMPDISSANYSYNMVSVLKNISVGGVLSFNPEINIIPGNSPYSIAAGDLDGDGKPDLVTANFGSNTVSVFRNKIGEGNATRLCPSVASTFFTSTLSGSTYQWQVGINNIFSNLADNNRFAGVNTSILYLNDIPSGLNGWKFRCLVDGNYSNVFELQFADEWAGAIDNSWENPLNWSCRDVPDRNTDVVINSGTIIINSNITVRSLKVNPGATVTVNAGFHLTVLH